MRATRALVGSLGAGISLAVAGSLAMLAISSVVAFRGWPDDLAAPGANPTALSAPALQRSALHRRSTATAIVLPARPHGARATLAPASGAVIRRSAVGSATLASRAGPATGTATATPGTGRPSGGPAHSSDATTGDAIRKTSHGAADAVRPVAPPAGAAIDSAGATAGDAVDAVGGAAAGITGGVLP
jgi:hypothetical protein